MVAHFVQPDGRPKGGGLRSENPRDTLWLLMTGVAVMLLAFAALGVAGELVWRRLIAAPWRRLLGRLGR